MDNMHNLTNQLTDILVAIAHDMVDARIEQKIADLQEGINVAAFDINDHRDDIINIVEEDLDVTDKVQDVLNTTTFTTTMD
jgi:hypothetical protein